MTVITKNKPEIKSPISSGCPFQFPLSLMLILANHCPVEQTPSCCLQNSMPYIPLVSFLQGPLLRVRFAQLFF